jgi:frataxin-like iron-binding protein CyaY
MNEGKKNCLSSGFHLMYSSNHWSNLKSTQEFVEHILMPYQKVQVEKLTLLEEQKMVWLIKC